VNARISISTTLVFGKTKYFKITIDDKLVQIPVAEAAYVNFQNQFKKKTTDQRNRFKTLQKLVEAAYRHGLSQSHTFSGKMEKTV
jgi:hypothetical protein